MTRYRTKPQTVEAVQWRGDNEAEVIAFFPEKTCFWWQGGTVSICGNEVGHNVTLGLHGWLVRFETVTAAMTEAVFAARFEPVEPREEAEGE